MNSKKDSLLVLIIFIPLSFCFNTYAQKGAKLIKAYLIITNNSQILKSDSSFKAKLISEVKVELKKKNYMLVSNSEMEEAGKPHLYIYVNISNKLNISGVTTGVNDFVIRVPLPDKTLAFSDKDELIKKIILYIKKYI